MQVHNKASTWRFEHLLTPLILCVPKLEVLSPQSPHAAAG